MLGPLGRGHLPDRQVPARELLADLLQLLAALLLRSFLWAGQRGRLAATGCAGGRSGAPELGPRLRDALPRADARSPGAASALLSGHVPCVPLGRPGPVSTPLRHAPNWAGGRLTGRSCGSPLLPPSSTEPTEGGGGWHTRVGYLLQRLLKERSAPQWCRGPIRAKKMSVGPSFAWGAAWVNTAANPRVRNPASP